MFFLIFVQHEDVIQIFDQKIFFEWLQYAIHHHHEFSCSISQAKMHEQPLKKAFFRIEGSLP
jgi:hypothetical protein